jgi:hypothetical protein
VLLVASASPTEPSIVHFAGGLNPEIFMNDRLEKTTGISVNQSQKPKATP